MQHNKQISWNFLQNLCDSYGLSVAGVASVAPLEEARRSLESWQGAGFNGEMGYMGRSPELLSSPLALLPEARSIVVVAFRYSAGPMPESKKGFGRVARYAWGRDYHRVIPKTLKRLVSAVEAECGGPIQSRIFADAVPMLERALAERSGLGFIGKNSMLITPGIGSFTLLGEILWDVQVSEPPLPLIKSHCGECNRCMPTCPTGAIVEPRRIDARRCISYLTIEKRGALDIWERRALGDWIFGCDICQEVCPFNHSAVKKEELPALQEFQADKGCGPYLDLKSVLSIRDDNDFLARFAGTPLMRPKREGLLRNAVIVAANSCASGLWHDLISAASNDSSPLVRRHAIWALSEIQAKSGTESADELRMHLNRALGDPDEGVQKEAKNILEGSNL